MRVSTTLRAVLAAATAAVLTLAVALPPPAAGANVARGAAAKCHGLSAAKIPFAALEASYRKLTGLPANTRLSKTQPQRYGQCGGTHYAFALLVVPTGVKLTYRQQVAQQDHSPVWVQKPGGQWVDEGIDDPCNLAPPSLINLWKVGVTCR
jgi:hypothetical protein